MFFIFNLLFSDDENNDGDSASSIQSLSDDENSKIDNSKFSGFKDNVKG